MVHEVGDVERNLSAIYWFHSFMAFSFMLLKKFLTFDHISTIKASIFEHRLIIIPWFFQYLVCLTHHISVMICFHMVWLNSTLLSHFISQKRDFIIFKFFLFSNKISLFNKDNSSKASFRWFSESFFFTLKLTQAASLIFTVLAFSLTSSSRSFDSNHFIFHLVHLINFTELCTESSHGNSFFFLK